MKKAILILIFSQFALFNYGQIIADHTVVDQYDKIPQQYIDSVKKMLVWVAGMSHSIGYQHGVELLELYDPKFNATTYMTATPPASANDFLRLGRPQPSSAGMWSSDFWRDYHSSLMLSQAQAANPYAVFLYAWCYDMTWHNVPQGAEDPVYHVRWAGDSEFGTRSAKQWGLDDADSTLTGNGMNMGTYLSTIEKFNADALNNGYKTISVFTTGPVDEDSETETGFQRELKQDYIRAYVVANPSAVLFDYADILCYNNNGEKNIVNWNDSSIMRSFEQIHPDNLQDYDASFNIIYPDGNGDPLGTDHIGEVGTLRVAKAMWWMLARIAGWDGGITAIPEKDKKPEFKIVQLPDKIIIESENLSHDFSSYSLYSVNGALIHQKKTGNNSIEIEKTSLASGIYVVALTGIQQFISLKIAIP